MELSAWPVLVVGTVLVLSLLLKAALSALDLPDLLGYLLIGVGLRGVQTTWDVLPAEVEPLLTFLAEFGVVALLFRIGLLSNIQRLVERLPGATGIWLANSLASLGVTFGAAWGLLGWDLLPSLFVAAALTATGIGVSARVWRSVYQLDSAKGALMLDVAELDDLTGVVLLAVLTALAPRMAAGGGPALGPVLRTLGAVLGALVVLTVGGVLFARYLEAPLTRWLQRVQPRPDRTITIAGVGLVVAGVTALLGFSVAIGGFFAGLLFSRDPRAVKIEGSFDSLYDLFVPFFFAYVGFSLVPQALVGHELAMALLLTAAVVGKGLGTLAPATALMPPRDAGLLTVSLLPRSEITLLVMQRGLELGVVPPDVFAVVVAVTVTTMVGVPLTLRALFHKTTAAPYSSADSA